MQAVSVEMKKDLIEITWGRQIILQISINPRDGQFVLWPSKSADRWSMSLNSLHTIADISAATKEMIPRIILDHAIQLLIDGARCLGILDFTLEPGTFGYLLFLPYSNSTRLHDSHKICDKSYTYFVTVYLSILYKQDSIFFAVQHTVCLLKQFVRPSASAFAAKNATKPVLKTPSNTGPFPSSWSQQTLIGPQFEMNTSVNFLENILFLAGPKISKYRMWTSFDTAIKSRFIQSSANVNINSIFNNPSLSFVLNFGFHKYLKPFCVKNNPLVADKSGVECSLSVISNSCWYVDTELYLPFAIQEPKEKQGLPLRLLYGTRCQEQKSSGNCRVAVLHEPCQEYGLNTFFNDIRVICDLATLWLPHFRPGPELKPSLGWPTCVRVEPHRILLAVSGYKTKHLCSIFAARAKPYLRINLGIRSDQLFIKRIEQLLSSEIAIRPNLLFLWQAMRRLIPVLQIACDLVANCCIKHVIVRSTSSIRIALTHAIVVEVECNTFAKNDPVDSEPIVLVRIVTDKHYPQSLQKNVIPIIENRKKKALYSNKNIVRGPRYRNYIMVPCNELKEFLDMLVEKSRIPDTPQPLQKRPRY